MIRRIRPKLSLLIVGTFPVIVGVTVGLSQELFAITQYSESNYVGMTSASAPKVSSWTAPILRT